MKKLDRYDPVEVDGLWNLTDDAQIRKKSEVRLMVTERKIEMEYTKRRVSLKEKEFTEDLKLGMCP